MSYTYDKSPSGDKLTITRCDEGHLQLLVTSGVGQKLTTPVCIAPDDMPEVMREMLGYGHASEGTATQTRMAAYRQASDLHAVLREERHRLAGVQDRLADEIAAEASTSSPG
jgi:hypothetical protein